MPQTAMTTSGGDQLVEVVARACSAMRGETFRWVGRDKETKVRAVSPSDAEVAANVYQRFAAILRSDARPARCLRVSSTRLAEMVAPETGIKLSTVYSSMTHLRRFLGKAGRSFAFPDVEVTLACADCGRGSTRFDIAVVGTTMMIDTRTTENSIDWETLYRSARASRAPERPPDARGEAPSPTVRRGVTDRELDALYGRKALKLTRALRALKLALNSKEIERAIAEVETLAREMAGNGTQAGGRVQT